MTKPPPRYSLSYQPNRYNGPNPLLRQFFAELNKRRMSQEYLCHHIGMSPNTLREWKRNRGARMDRLAEALRFLGLKLAIVPMTEEETNAQKTTTARPEGGRDARP